MRLLTLIVLVVSAMPAWALFEFVEDLTPPGLEKQDFGLGMTIHGDDLFIGWPRGIGDPDPAPACGLVVHFQRQADGRFQEQSVLRAPNCQPADMFGASDILLDGDELIIAAMTGLRLDGQGEPGDSRVYTFQRDPDYSDGDFNQGWRPVASFSGSAAGGSRGIGGAMRRSGDLLAVQSTSYESIFGINFARADGVYLFQRQNDGSWQEQTLITSPVSFFGFSFELTADQLIVGAPEAQTFGASGQVNVYDLAPGGPELVQTLSGGPQTNLGYFVSVEGERMAAGAVNLGGAGAIFLYVRDSAGQWQLGDTLSAPSPAGNDLYGIHGAFVDELLIISAENGKRQSAPSAGKVFVYDLSTGDAELLQALTSPVEQPTSDVFAVFTSNGEDLLVKAFGSPAGGESRVFHFRRDQPEQGPGQDFEISIGHSGVFITDMGDELLFDTLPDGKAAMFLFTRDTAGEPMYLLSLGRVEGRQVSFDPVIRTGGGGFGSGSSAEDIDLELWGSMVVEFDDCDASRLNFSGPAAFGSGESALLRLSDIAGVRCGETTASVLNGYSGSFINLDRPGVGLNVHVASQLSQGGPAVGLVYWTTYTPEGEQLWLHGLAQIDGNRIDVDEVLQVTGPAFGADDPITSQPWGSLSLDYFPGCDLLALDYQSEDADYGSGRVIFGRLYYLGLTDCIDSPSNTDLPLQGTGLGQ